jgi:hypothetical protein
MPKRRFIVVTCALLALTASASFAASKSSDAESSLRFYGKITNVNASEGSLTVHNKRKNENATFKLGDDTRVTENKQSISPNELKVGQSLVVYYVSENDISRARRISVRNPNFKKKE